MAPNPRCPQAKPLDPSLGKADIKSGSKSKFIQKWTELQEKHPDAAIDANKFLREGVEEVLAGKSGDAEPPAKRQRVGEPAAAPKSGTPQTPTPPPAAPKSKAKGKAKAKAKGAVVTAKAKPKPGESQAAADERERKRAELKAAREAAREAEDEITQWGSVQTAARLLKAAIEGGGDYSWAQTHKNFAQLKDKLIEVENIGKGKGITVDFLTLNFDDVKKKHGEEEFLSHCLMIPELVGEKVKCLANITTIIREQHAMMIRGLD